jgi:hypothetical protein
LDPPFFEDNITMELFQDQDATLERIVQAREQVLKLQKRVEEVREVHGQARSKSPVRSKSRHTSPIRTYNLPQPDIKTGKLDNMATFDDLEQAASSPVARNYPTYSAPSNEKSSDHDRKSKLEESFRIEQEIEQERQEFQRSKPVREKSQKKGKEQMQSVPSWEKVDKPVSRKPSRAQMRRVNLPLAEPFSPDDPVGRDMPFIVGQVTSFN